MEIQANDVIMKYKEKLSDLSHENIILKVQCDTYVQMINELQQEIQKLNHQLIELKEEK